MSASTEDADIRELEEVEDKQNVVDEAEEEKRKSTPFSITAFGGDPSVYDLVRRLKTDRLKPPPFQRAYVWSLKDASRFVETLLMGLPVPGIFIFKDAESGKDLIIDGQQRLLTLKYFIADKIFKGKEFRLEEVAEPWNEKTFDELEERDRSNLEESAIHVTYFKQELPKQGDRSMYEVFERINTGGLKLSAQEIRTCVSYGPFVKLLATLNLNEDWRAIYGKPSSRLKDIELILRFLALLEERASYSRPMSEFLDTFLGKHACLTDELVVQFTSTFNSTIKTVRESLGTRAFRPSNALNAAVFDSVMIGIAERNKTHPKPDVQRVQEAYGALLADKDYISSYVRATSDEDAVSKRIDYAIRAFAQT